jgi:outer membrane lipoprotein-sorting protein
MKGLLAMWALLLLPLAVCGAQEAGPDAQQLVADSFNYWRGDNSVSVVEMVVHRPDWERRMTIKAWTRGEKDSLFRTIAPARDAGNGTLKIGPEMWIFNPRVNRVIKVPPAMMSQSWMGSDFSNNDLAKSDTLINDYIHTIDERETVAGRTVFHVTSTPREDAPVVWGLQKLKIRDDLIFLEQVFFDEDLEPVKAMTTLEIRPMGGRDFPVRMRMQKTDEKDAYTELRYRELSFDESIPERYFTRAALQRGVR